MDNKLSELSKPVAWKIHNDDHYFLEKREEEAETHGRMGKKGDAVYSQEYVSALLAELEAVKAENALFRETGDYLIQAAYCAQERATAAEAKLATPVRLPEPCVYEVNGTRFYDRLSEAEVIASLREQGFTVEGDE